MKKVFSVKKFEQEKKRNRYPKGRIEFSKNLWANKCDGLTAEEMMTQYGCATSNDWMIEVEDKE